MRIALSFLIIFLLFVIGCTKSEGPALTAKDQKSQERGEQQPQKGDEAQGQRDVLNSLIDRVK